MIIDPSAWTTQPWKNGGGVTHEIWRWTDPASGDLPADGFDLRLSVAEIAGAGPFSVFAGYYRTLVVLEDSPLHIVIDDVDSPMPKHHAFHFSGETHVATRGIGRAMDLNVVSRVARRAAVVEIARAPSVSARSNRLAVFALDPTEVREGNRAACALGPRQVWIPLDPNETASLQATAPVVWIHF